MDETNELRKWIDDKCEKINEELCNFFESEEAKKNPFHERLSDIHKNTENR